jgi:acylphosphatase
MKCKIVFITGRVQGVGFRYYVNTQAKLFPQVVGWVRNLDDGRVQACFQSLDESAINELIRHCGIGPEGSLVTNLEIREERCDSNLSNFSILRDLSSSH